MGEGEHVSISLLLPNMNNLDPGTPKPAWRRGAAALLQKTNEAVKTHASFPVHEYPTDLI